MFFQKFPTLQRKEEVRMRLMRFVSAVTASGMLSFALVGAASADSASLSTTGPNSDNGVSISNTNTTNVTNTNNVQIVNANEQQASSGGVSAKSNTAVMGGLGSGSAVNNNTTNNTIAISNAAISPLPGTPGSGAGSPVSNPGSGAGSGAGAGSVSAGKGAVLGASVTPGKGGGAAPAVLPATGALVPVDVSALRNAWHNAQAAVPAMPKSGAISTAMLAIAALLAVGGAALNTVYARRRREGKVVL
jgi:hypothetical protein